MRIAIIGADGMLGSEFVSLCKIRKKEYSEFTIKDVDITNKQTLAVVEQYAPTVIINCAAYTAVDKAEDDKLTAFAVNSEGVKNLAELALSLNAKFIHFSTDYVFPGDGIIPYVENDKTGPKSVYGESKLQGEEHLRRVLVDKQYLLLRTAWLYGEYGNNFVKTMIRLAREGKDIKVVNDQFGSPTFAKDLAVWTMELIDKNISGVFHATNNGACSWYDFAKKIFELQKMSVNLTKSSSEQYITKAERPKFSIMDNSKLKKALGYSIREWQEALSEYLLLTKI
ncbi:MAG: dTDP-4-dehydrorhamnose reductase [Candidatus Margulisbacteria bacterium]|nr:dTDP-4-dehydrorhamnose reductase [Candidatus Margulisiibacteriota bacterium]